MVTPVRECDLCGGEGPTETLGWARYPLDEPDDRGDGGDLWRLARVCEACRDGKVTPTLRHLFDDGGLSLEGARPTDREWRVEVPRGSVFWAFETGRGTTHIARSVRTGPALGWRSRCVAECGIEADADPDAKAAPLSGAREGVICGRCEKSRPGLVARG